MTKVVSEVDDAVLRELRGGNGRRRDGATPIDIVDGPDGWSEDLGYGGRIKATPPPKERRI
jgi:hypothetical protein